jgi:hypothetical protein
MVRTKISVSVSVDIDTLDKIEDMGLSPTAIFKEGLKAVGLIKSQSQRARRH